MYYFGCFLISLFCVANAYSPIGLPIDTDFINAFNEPRIDPIKYRLPNTTAPNSYDITLATNVDKGDFSFTGSVSINLRVLEKTRNITIHARQLTVDEDSVTILKGLQRIKTSNVYYEEDREFLTIEAATDLAANAEYQLIIEYNGTLRTDMAGFYRSSYVDSDGKTK